MAKHLYIAGVDRTLDYQKNTLQIEQALTYEIDTCQFQVKGNKPAQGDEIIIEDNVLGRLFAGIIDKVELAHDFPHHVSQIWEINCNDYTNLLDRKLVVERYQGKTADWIFRDITAKYCPDFTVNGVRSGAPEIEDTGKYLAYVYPSKAYKWLCDYIGWHWQPSYYKDLGFFSTEELASPAPLNLVPGGPFRFGKHTIDTQGLRNRVYVIGGTMLSDPKTIEWKADGVATQWVLPWKPSEYSFSVAGTPVSVGLENTNKEIDYDYMLNPDDQYIRCSVQTNPPIAGATMSLTAKQDIDVITMVEDIDSQNLIASVQGGDGVYEHVITDDSLVTIEAAEAAGLADLREYANPKVNGDFETEVNGWAPGQLVNIALSDRGIEGTFLVQKVTITPFNRRLWTYTIKYGGRIKGIADFLAALVSAQQQKKTGETSILQKFVYNSEVMQVEDDLVLNSRMLPYVCGDSDAICGLTVVDDYYFSDDFEREDVAGTLITAGAGSAGTIGVDILTTNTGETWYKSGTWTRDVNGIKGTNTGWRRCYFDSRVANGSIEANITYHDRVGLCFRINHEITDTSNLIYAIIQNNYFRIKKIEADVETTLAGRTDISLTDGTEYNLRVDFNGSSIEMFLDDVSVLTVTETFNQTCTYHGLFSNISTLATSEWDNILFTSSEGGGVNILGAIWDKEYPDAGASISTTYAKTGTKSLRLELNNTDANVSGSKRSEIAVKTIEQPNEEHWYCFSIYLPDGGEEDYALDPDSTESIAQWHGYPDAEDYTDIPAPLYLATRNGKYSVRVAYCADAITTSENVTQAMYDLGSYVADKGHWVDWTFHVKWGWLPEHKTILEVYKNDVLVLERNNQPNMYNDAHGVYQKLGIYKWDWNEPDYGGSILTKRVIYYDAIKVK